MAVFLHRTRIQATYMCKLIKDKPKVRGGGKLGKRENKDFKFSCWRSESKTNMAGSVVASLMRNLGALLMQEASLLGGLHSSFDDIRLELQSMQSFIRDADRKKDINGGVRTWVEQIRNVAYEVEDIIDEFMYRIAKHDKGLRGTLHSIIHLPKNVYYKHQIATRLQEIKCKIDSILERGKRYGLLEERPSSSNGENCWHYAELAHFVADDDLVGIEENREFLISWLIDEEPSRMVLSVVGMGGLGKTTLVTKVYNCQEVKNHFNCYVWITVSQSYKTDELLKSIMKEVYSSNQEALPNNIGEMNYRNLVDTLVDHLQTKRYVIVLDDVWNIDVWHDINVAFPDTRCGSRVMLTTRNEDAASCLGTGSNVFKLEPLNHVDAWTLFCRKAFWNEANESCPPELETYAQSLVQRCAGLPLAIAAIGGLMSLKEKTALEWKKVQDSLSWELGNNPNLERMKNILLLSFHDLPYHLKYCFLYCSLFPEDYTMRRKKLIRLWVAEGFVEERRGLTLEEVSETYLNELICRSMLQVLEIHTHGTSKSLKVHDLMRDLSLSIGLEENFCMIYNGEGAIENMKARRLSIQSNSENISNCTSMARLRTLFWFPIDVSLSTSFSSMAPTFKLLRVLDLQASSITSVPKELCNLFSLRYLSLKETEVKKLPKSLGRLQNLQTLDLRDSKIEKLPRGIEKMKSLRHIYLSRYTRQFNSFHIVSGMQAPKGICKLKCLQSLVTVEANDSIIRLVGNLVQLRKFEVTNVRDVDGVPFCSSIQNMKCLLSLHVIAANEEETLQLESISSPPPLLQKLLLTGRMERLPDWVVSLRNLTFLSLIWTRMKEDPLSSLRALSNLVVLILNKAYDGQQLSFYTGCFPKLKVLYFAELASLNWIQIEEGAMPCLKVMYLIGCKELKMLPQGTEYLTDLQELYLREMPKELIERLDGDDYMKVEHVPCIWITENH